MTQRVRNPAALRLLIGWAVVAVLTVGGLIAAGFRPEHPAFSTVVVPSVVALLLQGGTALMAAKRGHEKLGWAILLVPPLVFVGTVVLFFVVFAAGIS